MTDEANTEADGQHTETNYEAGDRATDRDAGGALVVIAHIGRTAEEHVVASAGESVAEINPEYPADSPVVFATFRGALEEAFGTRWEQFDPAYLAFQVGDQGVPVYSFPEARLGPAQTADEDAEVVTDGGENIYPSHDPDPANDLTQFQVHLLAATADLETDVGGDVEGPNGLRIKDHLEEGYENQLNHGRLYPNLDTLVDMGLLQKGSKDRRTNEYTLARRGRDVLRAEVNWLQQGLLTGGEVDDE